MLRASRRTATSGGLLFTVGAVAQFPRRGINSRVVARKTDLRRVSFFREETAAFPPTPAAGKKRTIRPSVFDSMCVHARARKVELTLLSHELFTINE